MAEQSSGEELDSDLMSYVPTIVDHLILSCVNRGFVMYCG